MENNQRLVVLETSMIGAFLAVEAKKLANRGCLIKTINETLSAPLGKARKLPIQTDFSSFSLKFNTIFKSTSQILNTARTTDLPSQFVISAGINTGIFINRETATYSEGSAVTAKIAQIFSLQENDKECFLFIATLLDLLIDEGYFRYKHIQTLLDLHIGTEQLHKVIDYMFKFSKDPTFIYSAVPDPSILKTLSFNEVIVAKAIFYLLQTFQIRDVSKLPGRKPKFLASNLVTVADPYISDVIILYSALFAASDHYTTLYRKPFYLVLDELLVDFEV